MKTPLRAVIALVVIVAASRADAFPAFARKYGMSCSACHVGWPVFNQQGQNFRDNGFQFGLSKDDPVALSQDYLPVSLRTTVFYQFTRMTNQPSDQGPTVTQVGGVPLPPSVDVLTGGVLAKDVSFLLVLTGFGPDGTAVVESAWARLDNLGGTGWLNVKVGKFELDLPASSHRNVTLTTGYAAYGAHPQGTSVAFDMGENQVGVEIDGHSARSSTRYALAFTSANGGEGLSKGGWSTPMLYGHVEHVIEIPSRVFPWVQVGAFGGVGWWPTSFKTITSEGGTPTNIPGTGTNLKAFYRVGPQLNFMLGYPATPLLIRAAYVYGWEEAGLASGTDATGFDLSTSSNSFNGGFGELDWVPFSESSYNALPWMFFARYDVVRFKHGAGDVDGGTIGVRRYLAIGPRASAAVHVEGHIDRTKGVGAAGPDGIPLVVQAQSVLAGIDLDF